MRELTQGRKTKRIYSTALAVALSTLAAASLSSCASPPGVADYLSLSPHWDYRTLETEHFRLTFPKELEDVARQSGLALEEAHRILTPILKWDPTSRPGPTASKTHVLVIDNIDSANGLTSAVGRFGMVFNAKPPENWFSIYAYDDWLKLLAIHEYTHFLNMDPTVGYAEWLRIAFSDVALPNSLWPRWMLEGLAVYMETRHTGSGRGRSSYYEMVLRAAVADDLLDRPEFITLDRINGQNPYYPLGETAYLFGYHLMNRIASEPYGDEPRGDKALGEMSYRSAGRIPFLINTNLEEITGKDWYRYWREWVDDTRKRASAQIEAIRSNGETRYELLTHKGRDTLGSAFSPDGRWLAYTQSTDDESMGIYVRDLQSGKTRRVERKSHGATMAFTPDSRHLIMSALRRNDNYNLINDLLAYDLERDELRQLSRDWRASDPDVSPDGTQVAFAQTAHGLMFLSIAPIERDEDGRIRLGEPRRIYDPVGARDAVHTPKFASADGKKIVFTRHRNGHGSEELVELDLASEPPKVRVLVDNGAYNRFPTVHLATGDIYFVSDISGVNNLYRLSPQGEAPTPTPLTNLLTGMMFPSIDAEGRLYAGIFATRGWNLARLEIPPVIPVTEAQASISPPRLDPPPSPPQSEESQQPPSEISLAALTAPVTDYSVWPSILPRQWTPLLWLNSRSVSVGGQLLGFDAADRHRYFGALLYDLSIGVPDISLAYANRTLGPTLTLSGQQTTTSIAYDFATGQMTDYLRNSQLYFGASYPIRSTYWTLTPSLAVTASQTVRVQPGANPSDGDIVTRGRFLPAFDAGITYANTESSDLAITAERGRGYALGARIYPIGMNRPVYKGYAKANEYIPLGNHHVLLATLKGQLVSEIPDAIAASVNTQGRSASSLLQSLPADSLDRLAIRGYPNMLYYSKSTAVASMDWRFPIARIFRGWGTQPLFLNNLFGFAFGEASYFPDSEPGVAWLPSAGGGLRLSTELFNQLPIVISAEYHQGFATSAGGRGEFFVQMGLSNFGF